MMKFPGKALCPLLVAFLFASFTPFQIVAAQDAPVAVPPSAATATQETSELAADSPPEKKYYYEQPTRQKLSRLYWALGFLDINNDEDVDNYLMFNECEIYKSEFFNELEWKDIRESARTFLKENKDAFPIRFEVVQPLYLGEYDVRTKKFDVLDEYKISPTTRLEIKASDYDVPPCIDGKATQIPRYPAGILAEFNLPLKATQIPVDPAVAELYIQEKAAPLKERSRQTDRDITQTTLFSARDAYIFIRVKFFAAKGFTWQRGGGERANILTILEGVEVYADRDKKMLLWKKEFRKKRPAAAGLSGKSATEDASTNEPVQAPADKTPSAQ